MRFLPHLAVVILALSVLALSVLVLPFAAEAQTRPRPQAGVAALPPEECNAVRHALENGVPVGPGFRRRDIQFPANAQGIKGTLCRLLAVGTGAHMEGERIRTLADMQSYLRQALENAGWYETQQTKRFASDGQHGRHVFALFKDNAICVATTVVGLVEGATPSKTAIHDGAVYLGNLKPHEREWWVAVDCFHL